MASTTVVALAGLAHTVALADSPETDAATVESIVATASRLDQPADMLSQPIEVITRDDIDRLWAASTAEVLRQVPGTNVIQQGGRGGVSNILLRGGEPNFTVVLIDGVQVNDPTNTRGGSYDLSSLEQNQIENVEIVFGAMSPVYGSDALSGVVNFITRSGAAGSSVSLEGGTQGYASGSAFYGGTIGNVETGIGVYGTSDEGDVEGADYNNVGFNGRFATEFGETGTAGLSVGYQETDSESFPEDSGGPELAVIREVDQREADDTRIGLNLGYVFAGRWKTNLLANYYNRDESYQSPGIAPGVLDAFPPNGADSDFDRTQLLASVGSDFGDNVTALVGIEWQKESGSSDGYVDFGAPEPLPTNFDLERNTYSAFGEASLTLGQLVLTGGLRWDDPDKISSEITGRAGLIYRLTELTELRANWGQGFKAPSFFALGFPLVGNPDLNSETATSIDASIRREFASLPGAFEFGLFHYDYDDLIDFDPEQFTNVNRDNVVSKGAEAAFEVRPLETLYLRAHVTYLDNDVKGEDVTLRSRPEWRGGATVDWEFLPDWRWVTTALALDDFYESSVPTGGVWLDGYLRVDTSVTWQATEALSIGLAVDNLFDEDYFEAVGFPAAGTRGRLGARYQF